MTPLFISFFFLRKRPRAAARLCCRRLRLYLRSPRRLKSKPRVSLVEQSLSPLFENPFLFVHPFFAATPNATARCHASILRPDESSVESFMSARPACVSRNVFSFKSEPGIFLLRKPHTYILRAAHTSKPKPNPSRSLLLDVS